MMPGTAIEPPSLPFRNALVYGLGSSGRAAARLLLRGGAAVRIVGDDLEEGVAAIALGGDGTESIDVTTGPVPSAPPATVDLVCPSPGVPLDRPLLQAARAAGVPLLGELELAARLSPVPLLAVTGSNGKSTTCALLAELLRDAGVDAPLGGNYGTPLADLVLDAPGAAAYVVEVSSFQLETVEELRPRVAAVLNLSPDHLDRHGTLDRYAELKRRIARRQGDGDVLVLNRDDRRVAAMASGAELDPAVRVRWFSRRGPVGDGCFVEGERVLERRPGRGVRELFGLSDLALQGAHNLENAMAAALVALSLPGGAVDAAGFRATVASFRGLPHRMQLVAEENGVRFYDDSKGTNVGATLKSLEGMPPGRVHLILGGLLKGGDPAPLRPAVGRCARHVYLIGADAEVLARALDGAAPLSRSDRLEHAVEEAVTRARRGDVVLLSPACASFDQFRDYRHRGDAFRRLVEARVGGAAGREEGA